MDDPERLYKEGNRGVLVQARQVEAGDTILWCGRRCHVLDVEFVRPRASGTQRPGRRFEVQTEFGLRRPHWFYDELVEVVPDA